MLYVYTCNQHTLSCVDHIMIKLIGQERYDRWRYITILLDDHHDNQFMHDVTMLISKCF